jgi:putative salt-induced outer membrane protein
MFKKLSVTTLLLFLSQAVSAQDPYKFSSQLELGAIFTSGNTEDENVKFKGSVAALRGSWEHNLSVDGFRSSKQKELAAQRLYTVASSTYSFSEDNFILSRAAHEDDRFSGFDSQSDISVSYGQLVLRNRLNMSLNYTIGAGVRNSHSPEEDFSEGIVRLATDYSWNISENALFVQSLSVEAGETSSISRSETSIQSSIMENLSMKFAVKLKHQSVVPPDRKKTDTESSVTLLLSF